MIHVHIFWRQHEKYKYNLQRINRRTLGSLTRVKNVNVNINIICERPRAPGSAAKFHLLVNYLPFPASEVHKIHSFVEG